MEDWEASSEWDDDERVESSSAWEDAFERGADLASEEGNWD